MCMKAASSKIQNQWIPKNFTIDDEFGCLTNAENLAKKNPDLKLQVGRTRLIKEKWGDHCWCVNPKGKIIDPYFQYCFPTQWHLIEYKNDPNAFDGNYA